MADTMNDIVILMGTGMDRIREYEAGRRNGFHTLADIGARLRDRERPQLTIFDDGKDDD